MRFFFALVLTIAPVAAQPILIQNVSVIDTAAGSLRRTDVLVAGQKIISVGPTGKVPAGAQIVNATGKFLIPGLWDMHVHLWEAEPMLNLYVANGVTGVRDMGSDFARTKQWRAEVSSGRRIGPQIYSSGSPLEGPHGPSGKLPLLRVTTPEEARTSVDRLDNGGVDFIKVLSALRREEYESLAQRARVRRIAFAGHVPDDVPLDVAIDLRQKSMEHLFGMLFSFSPLEPTLRTRYAKARIKGDLAEIARVHQRAVETFSETLALKLFRRMAAYDVAQCPTLTLLQRMALIGLEGITRDPRSRYVPLSVRSGWQDPMAAIRAATPERLTAAEVEWILQKRIVEMMARSGVTLLAGTDTGDDYVLPGFTLHDELALLVEAGVSPLQALQAATLNPARFFGVEQLQ